MAGRAAVMPGSPQALAHRLASPPGACKSQQHRAGISAPSEDNCDVSVHRSSSDSTLPKWTSLAQDATKTFLQSRAMCGMSPTSTIDSIGTCSGRSEAWRQRPRKKPQQQQSSWRLQDLNAKYNAHLFSLTSPRRPFAEEALCHSARAPNRFPCHTADLPRSPSLPPRHLHDDAFIYVAGDAGEAQAAPAGGVLQGNAGNQPHQTPGPVPHVPVAELDDAIRSCDAPGPALPAPTAAEVDARCPQEDGAAALTETAASKADTKKVELCQQVRPSVPDRLNFREKENKKRRNVTPPSRSTVAGRKDLKEEAAGHVAPTNLWHRERQFAACEARPGVPSSTASGAHVSATSAAQRRKDFYIGDTRDELEEVYNQSWSHITHFDLADGEEDARCAAFPLTTHFDLTDGEGAASCTA
eukprot:CAMPEP_0117575584 /NCGR_PEP_ID=MMETSP0784-20121206/62284_1 /TAXON_ID=39447 /ORGANISM="" /LENGTH=412 /DNA_ID=CAMNT_0005374663 /DNA_START=25 /DNA_END=1263 /DNA_ORIENTATION=+